MRPRSLPGFVGVAACAGLVGCTLVEPMPGDQPCKEVGWAIASRTHDCTGDVALANDRHAAFDDRAECIEWEADDPALDEIGAEDLFSCAFTLRNLPCETIEALGDDFEAWLETDEACAYVVSLKGGA